MQKLRRIWRSREARKFFRNTTAVIALCVIGLYLLVGLAVMLGAVTKEQCAEVVGPTSVPGFFRELPPEKRYDHATTSFFAKVERALNRKDPTAALGEVKLGRYRVADKSLEDLRKIVTEVDVIKKQIAGTDNLDNEPSMLPVLKRLEEKTAEVFAPLSSSDQFYQNMAMCLGTDAQGRSIFLRAVYSIKIALLIGMVTATISVLLGAILGAAAGYFGGWVDHLVVWLYTTFSSIPGLVLLVVIAYAFTDMPYKIPFTDTAVKDTLLPVYIAFCATFWIGTCRIIRGETMKLKQLEFVQAARTAGFGSFHVLFRHVIPNTAHLMLINFSLLLIGAIKSEVILSFLGLGVKSQPSWGIMIRDAGSNGDVMNGFFWQIGTATAFMFVLVLAFNILSDALQDALDPRNICRIL